MGLSPQWPDEERLEALALLATRIKSLATLSSHSECSAIIWVCADAAMELATASTERLEVFRRELVKEIHGN